MQSHTYDDDLTRVGQDGRSRHRECFRLQRKHHSANELQITARQPLTLMVESTTFCTVHPRKDVLQSTNITSDKSRYRRHYHMITEIACCFITTSTIHVLTQSCLGKLEAVYTQTVFHPSNKYRISTRQSRA